MSALSGGRKAQNPQRFRCVDCGIDTAADDYHMVEADVWAAGAGKKDGMLCVADLERRLGRKLRREDFLPTNARNRKFWGGFGRMYPNCWRPLDA